MPATLCLSIWRRPLIVNDRIRSNGFFFSLAELLNSGNRRFHLPCDATSVERECSAEDVSEVCAHRLLGGISIELAKLCRREHVARHRFAADREATARRLHCPVVVLAPQYRQQLRRPHYLNLPTPVNRAPRRRCPVRPAVVPAWLARRCGSPCNFSLVASGFSSNRVRTSSLYIRVNPYNPRLITLLFFAFLAALG